MGMSRRRQLVEMRRRQQNMGASGSRRSLRQCSALWASLNVKIQHDIIGAEEDRYISAKAGWREIRPSYDTTEKRPERSSARLIAYSRARPPGSTIVMTAKAGRKIAAARSQKKKHPLLMIGRKHKRRSMVGRDSGSGSGAGTA